MNETEINWTAFTWNPASGCDVISPECRHCYAKTLAENKRGTRAFPNGFDITLRPHKLAEPKRLKVPSLIFTSSMTDVFHDEIPDSYRDQIFDVMRATPQHRYQVLTKRTGDAREYFKTRKVPDNVWLGATVGHSSSTWRLDDLRAIDARVRFVSAEPLLSSLAKANLDGISWLISGGESGFHLSNPKHLRERALVRRGDPKEGEARYVLRDDRAPWIRELRDACVARGIAFWHKQNGGPTPASGGRLIDGRTWDEMPTHVPGAMPSGYVHKTIKAKGADKLQLPLVAS